MESRGEITGAAWQLSIGSRFIVTECPGALCNVQYLQYSLLPHHLLMNTTAQYCTDNIVKIERSTETRNVLGKFTYSIIITSMIQVQVYMRNRVLRAVR